MTKLQFISLLSPAVGSFVLVLLAWLQANLRLNDLQTDTTRQISDLRADTNRQFGEVQRQFDKVNATLETLSTDYRNFYGMEQKLEGRVDELSKRI